MRGANDIYIYFRVRLADRRARHLQLKFRHYRAYILIQIRLKLRVF